MNYFPSHGSTYALASSVFMPASFSLSLNFSVSSCRGLGNKQRSRLSPCQEMMVFLQRVQMRSREQSCWDLVATWRISALFDPRCFCASPRQQTDANSSWVGRSEETRCYWISSAPSPARHLFSGPPAASASHHRTVKPLHIRLSKPGCGFLRLLPASVLTSTEPWPARQLAANESLDMKASAKASTVSLS